MKNGTKNGAATVKPKIVPSKNGKKVEKKESSSDEDDSDSDEEVRFLKSLIDSCWFYNHILPHSLILFFVRFSFYFELCFCYF